jgi:endo-1,4-beta-xylanase
MLKMIGSMGKFSALMLLALVVTVMLSFPGSTHPSKNALRSLAQKQGIQFGVAVNVKALSNDPSYRALLAQEFKWMTPENAMKFKAIHSKRDRYDFTEADTLVEFAQQHQMQVRGHTLVWHKSLPNWLEDGQWTREELMDIMREHINNVMGHYRGQLVAWDVVNEAISDDQSSRRKTIWQEIIGPDYIEMAFRWAHEADPNVPLFYNDYNGEELGAKSDAIYDLVKDLQERGVSINGVGLQMHVGIKNPPDPQQVAANIKRLNDLGLEVQITEMDVKIGDGTGTREERLAAQAKVYQDMMQVCLDAENCTAFLLWGVTDRYSWIPRLFNKPDAPLIFDESGQPKPAYKALKELLQ